MMDPVLDEGFMTERVELKRESIETFCRKWKIQQLALFGSALGDDFRTESDVDFLVTFSPNVTWGLLDHAAMERELTRIVGRPVDLVSRKAVERSHNWIRRQAILKSAKVLYAA
jgi:predicted nucleotidyltransferase